MQRDRRTAVRRTTRIQTRCRLRRATGEGPWQATVRNLSANGIGLIADRQFKRNMLLAVELPNAAPKLIRVTHAQAQPGGKWWVYGGIFASGLSEEEMGKLV